MSANTNSNMPANNVNTALPYAEQMQELASRMRSHIRGGAGTFHTYHDLSGGWPENTSEVMSYTYEETVEAGQRFVSGAFASGAKYASGLPATPSKTGVIAALGHVYEVTRGDNKGAKRNLVMNALAGVRRAAKRAARKAAFDASVAEAQENGGAFYAQGIVDGDGNPRPYPTAEAAQKAWARHKDNFGDTWWHAGTKAKALAAAAKVVRQGLPASSTTIQDLSASKARALAKSNGAPESVYTGAGAGNRSRNWLLDNGVSVA
jgi:hypothetical protein